MPARNMKARLKLSKSLYMKGLQCHKALHLSRYRPELKGDIPPEREAIFEAGIEVGRVAQGLFPGGVEVAYGEGTLKDQVARTLAHIEMGEKTIYEATFSHGGVLAKIDILHRSDAGWEIYEVKMSTRARDEHLEDVSLQYFVAVGAGLNVSRVCVVSINNSYELRGEIDVRELFSISDVTDVAKGSEDHVKVELAAQVKMLSGPEPDIDIGRHCFIPYECDFKDHCWAHVPADSVFDLSGRGGADKYELYERGILRLEDIPLDGLSGKQRIEVESSLKGINLVNREKVREFLSGLEYPLYFLDFETYGPPVPLFDGTRPYQGIPFQYSLHLMEGEGGDLKHFEFLAEGGSDPREGVVKNLIENISEPGTILVYHAPFERGVLRNLAGWFPEYSEEIEEILSAIIDLETPFKRRDVYFPGMKGSSSMKAVLPALVPELTYEGMSIASGGMASFSFGRLRKSADLVEIMGIREDLLRYCRLDTLGMVRIVQKLRELTM